MRVTAFAGIACIIYIHVQGIYYNLFLLAVVCYIYIYIYIYICVCVCVCVCVTLQSLSSHLLTLLYYIFSSCCFLPRVAVSWGHHCSYSLSLIGILRFYKFFSARMRNDNPNTIFVYILRFIFFGIFSIITRCNLTRNQWERDEERQKYNLLLLFSLYYLKCIKW